MGKKKGLPTHAILYPITLQPPSLNTLRSIIREVGSSEGWRPPNSHVSVFTLLCFSNEICREMLPSLTLLALTEWPTPIPHLYQYLNRIYEDKRSTQRPSYSWAERMGLWVKQCIYQNKGARVRGFSFCKICWGGGRGRDEERMYDKSSATKSRDISINYKGVTGKYFWKSLLGSLLPHHFSHALVCPDTNTHLSKISDFLSSQRFAGRLSAEGAAESHSKSGRICRHHY